MITRLEDGSPVPASVPIPTHTTAPRLTARSKDEALLQNFARPQGRRPTAYQLGHAYAKPVRDLYDHGHADALERLKHATAANVVPLRATSLPYAAEEPA